MSDDVSAHRAITLAWQGDTPLSRRQRSELLGRGAPYELAEDDVLGERMPVFVRRQRQLAELLIVAAERFGDRDGLVVADDPAATVTFAQLPVHVARVADTLARHYGVRKGDRVAIASTNSLGYILTEWAGLALGAIVTHLNGWWAGAELRYGIELTEPAVVVGDEPRLARVRDAIGDPGMPMVSLATLLEQAGRSNAAELQLAEIDEDEPALILFTSGTTGRPKGATLSHRNLIHAGLAGLLGRTAAAMTGGRPPVTGGVQICSLPFFHVGGTAVILQANPLSGTTLVLPPPGRFDPGSYLALTERYGLTSWSGVATQYWRILAHDDFGRTDLSTVRNVSQGGGPFPPALMRELRAKIPGVNLTNGCGSTEITGGATQITGTTLGEHPDAVGRPHPTLQLQVRGAHGVAVAEREVGEICVRGATVFRGYWHDADATAAVVSHDRWYHTGDYGRIEDGLLYIDSRRTDLIIRGGENIYPTEIEHRLIEHPDIVAAAVVGVPDRQLGQVPAAHVVLREGARLGTSDVQRWVADGLARFKVPAEVEFRESLPYTETGKVMKHELTEGGALRGSPRCSPQDHG